MFTKKEVNNIFSENMSAQKKFQLKAQNSELTVDRFMYKKI